MNRMKKALALLLALLLLAGCAQPGASSSSKPPGPSAPEEAGPISPEELDRLDRLALLYEKYCAGRTLSPAETVDADGWFAFGLLYQNGLLDPYWKEEYGHWEVPTTVFEGINRYFFQDLSQWDREEAKRLGDGSIQATYRRRSGEHTLTPVTYQFRPYALEEFPEALEGICQPGGDAVPVCQRHPAARPAAGGPAPDHRDRHDGGAVSRCPEDQREPL